MSELHTFWRVHNVKICHFSACFLRSTTFLLIIYKRNQTSCLASLVKLSSPKPMQSNEVNYFLCAHSQHPDSFPPQYFDRSSKNAKHICRVILSSKHNLSTSILHHFCIDFVIATESVNFNTIFYFIFSAIFSQLEFGHISAGSFGSINHKHHRLVLLFSSNVLAPGASALVRPSDSYRHCRRNRGRSG